MRKFKTICIDDREITVKELRVKDIKQLFNDNAGTLMDHLPLVTTLTAAEIEDMAPSEIAQVWEAVQEVNADFLALMKKSGIMEVIEKTAMQALISPSAPS